MTKFYIMDQDEMDKLRNIEKRLHSGTDKERDAAHRIWLILNNVEQHEYRDEGEEA